MARSSVVDPLDKFRFIIHIDGFSKAGFTQCGTPSYSIGTKEYPEGGSHMNPKQIIDKVSYVPVTLTRGVTNDTSFNKWAAQAFDLISNNSIFNDDGGELSLSGVANTLGGIVTGQAPKGHLIASNKSYPFSFRKTVVIEHLNRAGMTEVIYTLYNAFPIVYKPASDFDSGSDDTLSIDTLTLAFEGFDVRYTGISGTIANAAAGGIPNI